MKSQNQKIFTTRCIERTESQLLKVYEHLEKWKLTLDPKEQDEAQALASISEAIIALERASVHLGIARINTQNAY